MESYLEHHGSSSDASSFLEGFKTTVCKSSGYQHGVLCDRALDLEMDDFSIRIRSINALQEQKGSVCESVLEIKEIFKNLMTDERCSARMQNQIEIIQKGDYEDTKTGDLLVEFGIENLKHWARTEVLKGIAMDLD